MTAKQKVMRIVEKLGGSIEGGHAMFKGVI